METIQWYPGHMVKAKKTIREHLKVIDLVVELLDARVPQASRNPDLVEIIGDKRSVLVLNKSDLADKQATDKWLGYYKQLGLPGIAVNATHKTGIKQLTNWLAEQLSEITESKLQKGRISYVPKIMVVGIPNVGKSSLINTLGGISSAKTGNKPGVTKGQQWIKCDHFHLLDVPGVLWPKFDKKELGYGLAATGAIGDHVFSVEEVVRWLILYLRDYYPINLIERYKLHKIAEGLSQMSEEEVIRAIGVKRGCLVGGGEIDMLRTAELVLKEYREGKIGRITLENINYNVL